MDHFSSIPKELLYIIISHIEYKTHIDNLIIASDFIGELLSDDKEWEKLSFFTGKKAKGKKEYAAHKFKTGLYTLGIMLKLDFRYGNIKLFSMGTDHVIVVNQDNEIYAKGNNEYGQLGIGVENINKICVSNFYKIEGNFGEIKQISCGNNRSAFITEDDELYVFGCNIHNGVGYNAVYNNIYTPTKSFGELKVKRIECNTHLAFLTENDDLYITHGNDWPIVIDSDVKNFSYNGDMIAYITNDGKGITQTSSYGLYTKSVENNYSILYNNRYDSDHDNIFLWKKHIGLICKDQVIIGSTSDKPIDLIKLNTPDARKIIKSDIFAILYEDYSLHVIKKFGNKIINNVIDASSNGETIVYLKYE